MMQVLDLKNLVVGSTVDGICAINTVEFAPPDSKRPKISGTLSAGGRTVVFKGWDNMLPAFKQVNFAGAYAHVQASVSSYNGKMELTLSGISPFAGQVAPELEAQIYDSVDQQGIINKVNTFIAENLSVESAKIFRHILNEEKVNSSFAYAFAASHHHDNKIGGLMYHTYKNLRILHLNIEFNPVLQKYADLLYLGTLLHDIGKVHEMQKATYTPYGVIGHRYIGIEMISRYKDFIISLKDEWFFLHLILIIGGHHDRFEDPARSLWAYLIHLVDMTEAGFTGFAQKLERNEIQSNETGQYLSDKDHRFLYL